MELTRVVVIANGEAPSEVRQRVESVDVGDSTLVHTLWEHIDDDHSGGSRFWTDDIWLGMCNHVQLRNPDWLGELTSALAGVGGQILIDDEDGPRLVVVERAAGPMIAPSREQPPPSPPPTCFGASALGGGTNERR